MSFSTANLAVVAYALVKADGTTPEMNSGVKVDHVGTGFYNITLPGDESVQGNLPLQQGQGNHNSGPNWRRDLIIVTPTGSGPLMVGTDDQSDFVKQVYLSNNAGQVNSDFAIIIFRSTIPTPTDSNGDQDGPV